MKQTRRDHLLSLGAFAAASAVPAVALAENHEPAVHVVEMLNAHPDNKRERQVFVPDILRAKVGATIRFVSTDRGHNSESVADMTPAGGAEWKGKIGDDVEFVVETAGAYGYKCTPHASVGMVGLLLVGYVPGNYEEIKGVRQRGKAKKRWEDIFERADELLASESS